MIKKLNNKGFTLVELLAVLVILTAIMGIAIPSISSSLERSKDKQNESRYKILESAAELYVTDYKNTIYKQFGSDNTCYIEINELNNYLTADEMKDADGNEITGYIIFTRAHTTTNASGEEIQVAADYQYSKGTKSDGKLLSVEDATKIIAAKSCR